MSRRDPRKLAVLPGASYRRPRLADLDALTVRAVGEGGIDNGTYRFDDLGEPTPLLRSLVAGFAVATAPGGRWRRRDSVRTGSDVLRRLYRYLRGRARPVERVEDITPVIWAAWRSDMRLRSRWPGLINSSRALLHDVEGIPDDTLVEMRRRHRKPKDRLSGAYAPDEFAAIQRAAWATVDAATERIRGARNELAAFRDALASGLPVDGVLARRGVFLDHLARTGEPPEDRPSAVGLSGARSWHALFLTLDEVFALRVLFASVHGYNAATIDTQTATHRRPDGDSGGHEISTVDIEKARRAGPSRHGTENLVARAPRSPGGLYRLAVALTEPARVALAALGHPTDRLLIGRSHRIAQGLVLDPQFGAVSRHWAGEAGLLDPSGAVLRVSLQRLRLTEQVVHDKPQGHTQRVHDEIYVLREPRARRAAIPVILAGLGDAVDHARATVAMRRWSTADVDAARMNPESAAQSLGVPTEKVLRLVSGALDTALGGCLDFEHSPMSGGGSCRASFLLCLACPNAIATPRHLPRLVCLRDALVNVASAVTPKVWTTDYADHFARLDDLLSGHSTPEELAAAAARVTAADRDLVTSLLRRDLDA